MGKIVTRTTYVTEDGMEHNTHAEAEAHNDTKIIVDYLEPQITIQGGRCAVYQIISILQQQYTISNK